MAEPSECHGFPSTRWSMLEGAQTLDEEHRLVAIENFLQVYYEPLKNYLRLQFHLREDDAKDHIQEFILSQVIRKNLIARADRERGRFRSFVIQALNRFMFDEMRKNKAAKRHPGSPMASIEELDESALAGVDLSAASRFDADFACQVVHQAIARMRLRCEETNRQDLWRVFYERVLCDIIEGREPLPLNKLAPLLGVNSPAHASNLLTTAKRMFRRVFKSVIKDYESGEAEVEAEMRELRHILSNG